MRLIICAALALLVLTACAAAEPVALRCKTSGSIKRQYGTLSLVVDEAARYLRMEAPEKVPGARWEYRDELFGSIYTGSSPLIQADDGPVGAQFVKFTRATVEIGWRDQDGQLVHLAYFNRSALRGAACRWHSLWEFELAGLPE